MGAVFPSEKDPKRRRELLARELGVTKEQAEDILKVMERARKKKAKEIKERSEICLASS